MTDLEPHYAQTPMDDRAEIDRNPVHIVLDNIRSAFNVGSIFRTADAGAAHHMHLCGMTAHPPHKKLEKTALGAFEYVPWSYYERTSDCLEQLGEQGICRVAIEVTEDSIAMPDMNWSQPTAIVFGNEVTGINDRVQRKCDHVVHIPMQGYKNSMNVATAFGIVLFHVLTEWGAYPDTNKS
jgi:tRNA G18 (ribose-2'-O)-methylase SpoU